MASPTATLRPAKRVFDHPFCAAKGPLLRCNPVSGAVFYFLPTRVERHRYVATWFHDQEIHDFVGANLHLANNLTARTYNLLDRRSEPDMTWRQYSMTAFATPRSCRRFNSWKTTTLSEASIIGFRSLSAAVLAAAGLTSIIKMNSH